MFSDATGYFSLDILARRKNNIPLMGKRGKQSFVIAVYSACAKKSAAEFLGIDQSVQIVMSG